MGDFKIRPGIDLMTDEFGTGPAVERMHTYLVRLRMWLNKGESVRWQSSWGLIDRARLEDDGLTLITDLRIDRASLIGGLFYGVQGMRVGGIRKLRLSPHLAYGERGIPGIIPMNAVLVVEIHVLEERK